MKRYLMKWVFIPFSVFLFTSCGSNASNTNADAAVKDSTREMPSVKTAEVNYMADTMHCRGFIAYDENRKGKLPIVVVVHEWWGLNDYVKTRAKQLAALGYFAIDADMFGEGRIAATAAEAMAFTKPYYANPALAKTRLEAAIAKAKTFPQADSSRVAAIGYCYGGFVVLNAAKLGDAVKGTVSFHGDLGGVTPKKGLIQGDILVCQGGDDQFVPEKARASFKKSMDSVGAHYKFIEYAGATHAFTNPEATALGKNSTCPLLIMLQPIRRPGTR